MTTDVFAGQRVYVTGKFPGLQKDEVYAYLLGHGADGTTSKSRAQAFLCPDPTDAKLVATGKPCYTLDALGAPLEGYLQRLKAGVQHRREDLKRNKQFVCHLAHGKPASAALVAKVAAAIGFPVPPDLRALMGQFNGLSAAVAVLKRGASVELADDKPLPYAALADLKHPLWQGKIEWLIGVIGIPSWEDIFLRPQKDRLCNIDGYTAASEALKIGALKLKPAALFPRLFAFDLFHHYAGTALYADPKDETMKAIYAFDYWADLTSAHPVSLRAYMESLAAGIWGRGVHAGQRIIKPVSKTAWPTYIRNIHGAPYVFIELK